MTIPNLIKSVKKGPGIFVLSIKVDNYNETIKNVINQLINKNNLKGIYVTLNKPHSSLTKAFKTSNLFFIDAVSNLQKGCAKTCLHVNGLQSLTDLSIAITQLVSNKKFDLIFIDSISTLLAYNDNDMVERFIQFLINKLGALGVTGVFCIVDNKNSKFIFDRACQLSDKCFKL